MRRAQARGWQQLGIADSAATTRRPEVTQLTAGESSASQGMAPRPPCPAVIRRAIRLGASGLAPEAPRHMGDGHGAEDVYLSVGLTQVVYGGSACMCYNARINLRVPGHCNLQWRRGSLRTICLGCGWTVCAHTTSECPLSRYVTLSTLRKHPQISPAPRKSAALSWFRYNKGLSLRNREIETETLILASISQR